MTFEWKFPNKQSEVMAIERMLGHFSKPTELMPVPWLNSETGHKFHTVMAEELPATIKTEDIIKALDDIAGGLRDFPEVSYVPLWKSWFKYLLPYAISRSDEYYLSSVSPYTIAALMNVYPKNIMEEYPGFRNDVIYSLGTRIIPSVQPDPTLQPTGLPDRLYNDIWDYSYHPEIGILNEVGLPIIFCLKYLHSDEITSWVESLVKIDSPQWYLQLILWLLALNKFLHLAKNWPSDGNLGGFIEETGLIGYVFQIPRFTSLEAFISQSNLSRFQIELHKQLTSDVFSSWAKMIRMYSTPRISADIERILADFADNFFLPSKPLP